MPPSPAWRCSPGRGPRADSHKRGRSLEGGLLFREKDDDLALFNEMQSRERENFLLQSSDDLEDSFTTKLRNFSDIKLGITIPSRGESSNLLNAEGDKNDYDWLLTPPDTPLFPSMDDEPSLMNVASRARPRSKPISISRSSTMEKSYRSSRGSASPNRLSPSPRSGNNTFQPRGRPSSAPNSSPTQSLERHATPLKSSPPPNKPLTPAPRSSTPRRMITGSSSPAVSSGTRGASPVKLSRGNSASPKIRAWQTNIPGFSSEAPPNLRTSLADRPASYVRGSSPASRNGRDSTSKFSRQSMSPTASRSSSSFHSHDRDQFSSRSKGSVASSGDDDLDSLQSILVGNLDRLGSRSGGSISNNRALAFSKKSTRTVSPNFASKRSFDPALRQMDRKSPQKMFRPLLSSAPSTTFYAGKANSAHRSLVSRNSSVTTSSNGSSDQGASFAPDTEGSDHNQDYMASESEKILYPDIHEEVFAFDKTDALNENVGHEVKDESIDIQYNETTGPKIDRCPIESEDAVLHCIDTEVNESSEIFNATVDFLEAGSYENLTICSHCGCRYEPTDQAEKDIRLCLECSKKNKLLRVIIPETTLAFAEDSSVYSTKTSAEEKPLAETVQLMVASELPQEKDVSELRFSLGEQDAEESQTSCSELIQDHSQQSPLLGSLPEGGQLKPANLLEMGQSRIDYNRPDSDVIDQQLYNYNDRANLMVDLLEGTGISVLLKRSSSSKGPVVQGRTFTATTISYDDLSLGRDSVNSIRSSSGHGSYSASSSVDFSLARHAEFRVQQQLSGKKMDVEYGYDIRMKPQSTESSFSETSNYSHHGLGLTTEESSSGNTECGITEEISIVPQDGQASENKVADIIDASSKGLTVVEEDKYEHHGSVRLTDACSSELLQQAGGVQSDYNSVPSFTRHGDSIPSKNVENHPNNIRSVPNTEISAMAPGSSFDEEHHVQNSDDGLDGLPTTNSSTITESEIEKATHCSNKPGLRNDDLPRVLKSVMDHFQEPSVPSPSNDHLTASVPESNTSEYSHGLEESTVTVECQGAGNTGSLTLEEATDAILFCSSIIHDLVYRAATIAMERESSDPFKGSEPTVTTLGKPNFNRKDSCVRTVGKRALKSQKVARQRRVETEAKSPSGRTENDENINGSFTHNVGLPNKMDNMRPPKLESKCNCTIM